MRALTVRQPWAWAIAARYKTIENRSRGAMYWRPQHDVAIHAGKAWSHRGAGDERVRAAYADAYGLDIVGKLRPEMDGMRGGLIVALVDLVDVHPASGCCEPWGEQSYETALGDQTVNVTHLVLDNVRPLASPVVVRRGWLGLWTVPKEEAEMVRRL